jgi:hypothetical protein
VPSPALTGRVRAAAASGALLSYPERRVAPPPGRLQRALMDDRETMSIFAPRVAADPLGAAEGFKVQDFNNTMTEDVWGGIGRDAFVRTEWFECAACSASRALYAALNGLDEALDVGDDSQEVLRRKKPRTKPARAWGG